MLSLTETEIDLIQHALEQLASRCWPADRAGLLEFAPAEEWCALAEKIGKKNRMDPVFCADDFEEG